MNLKSAFALLAAGTFLVACGSDEVVNVNDEAKDKASITLKVMDFYGNSAVADASVYSVVDEETETTDSLGLSTWKKQDIGKHVFQISKEGYATVLATVDLDEQGKGNVARVGDAVANVYMYKKGVNAKGTVLYVDDKGNMKAAAGVKVYAILPKTFVPSEVSVEASATGEYSFSDLPEGVEITISVGQKDFENKSYALLTSKTIGGPTVRAGDVTNVDILSMTKVAGQLVKVSDNLDQIDTTTAVTLTFSAELVADSVKNKWTVRKSGSTTVLTVASLGSDKKSIVIKPQSGKWQKGASYTISGSAYSVEGVKSGSISETFTPGAGAAAKAPENISLTVATNTELTTVSYTYFDLKWAAPKDLSISSYHLYYKTDKTSDFIFFKEYSVLNIDDNTLTFYTTQFGSFKTGDKISFILLPVSGGIEADVTKAKAAVYTVPAPKTVTVTPVIDDPVDDE